MRKRRLLIWSTGIFLVLIIVFNIRSINNAGANIMLSLFKWRIHNVSSLGFRSKDVDSLYNRKNFRYLLFVKRLPIQNESVLLASQDSILIIKNKKINDWNVVLGCDTISLDESLFNFLIGGNKNSAFYSIETVERDVLNRYNMKKITGSSIKH